MATTTMGQSGPDITKNRDMNSRINRGTYWAIGAALAILLIFAYAASRNSSSVVTPTQSTSPAMVPADRAPVAAGMEATPAMDASSANVNSAAPVSPGLASPQTDTINNGAVSDPVMMTEPLQNEHERGTSVSPNAPKGTVER